MISDGQMTVGALAGALEDRFPSAMAEPWDRVGLIVGDPATEVAGVLVTLDATTEAVNRAVASGANVLVTHHPPFLEAPVRFVPAPGSAGTVAAALRQGCAVISLHTNLDRADEGASALAVALGLDVVEPLESDTEPVTLLTAMVPPEFEGAVRAAMEAAGAGRMGEYAGCAIVSDGVGHFTDGRLGQFFFDEIHRRLEQDAVGLAVFIPDDFPVKRIGRAGADTSDSQGSCVGPTSVERLGGQVDRFVR